MSKTALSEPFAVLWNGNPRPLRQIATLEARRTEIASDPQTAKLSVADEIAAAPALANPFVQRVIDGLEEQIGHSVPEEEAETRVNESRAEVFDECMAAAQFEADDACAASEEDARTAVRVAVDRVIAAVGRVR